MVVSWPLDEKETDLKNWDSPESAWDGASSEYKKTRLPWLLVEYILTLLRMDCRPPTATRGTAAISCMATQSEVHFPFSVLGAKTFRPTKEFLARRWTVKVERVIVATNDEERAAACISRRSPSLYLKDIFSTSEWPVFCILKSSSFRRVMRNAPLPHGERPARM